MTELNGVLMCPQLIPPEDCLRTKEGGETFNFQQKKGLGSQSDFIDYLFNLPRQKSGLVNRLKEMQRTTCLLLRLHGAEIENIV